VIHQTYKRQTARIGIFQYQLLFILFSSRWLRRRQTRILVVVSVNWSQDAYFNVTNIWQLDRHQLRLTWRNRVLTWLFVTGHVIADIGRLSLTVSLTSYSEQYCPVMQEILYKNDVTAMLCGVFLQLQ